MRVRTIATGTAPDRTREAYPIPARAGIGLRQPHHHAVRDARPAVGWLEAHSENYLGGGAAFDHLTALRRDYPVSLHGVGLSLGSAGPLDRRHLTRVAGLAARIEPALMSEHLSWSAADGSYLNDLLPLPYTDEALAVVCDHIDEVQEMLRRPILIENPSTYLQFRHSTMPEQTFLAAVAERTGCGILLDVNNLYVNHRNHGLDPAAYLAGLPGAAIGEMHLAGHHVNRFDAVEILIDDHGSPVADDVWRLYAAAIERFGPLPTLIEWDSNIPALAVLVAEAEKADRILAASAQRSGDVVAA